MEKVLLGMSGGKDSTWACRVLQKQGYEVEGLLLVLHENAPVRDAQLAAQRLAIKLHIADRTELFAREVEDCFVREYTCGRTPNPCVECNSKIKFGTLLEEADRLGIEKISTGHYVRTGYDEKTSRYTIEICRDQKKDQSYFLWKLGQHILSRYISPLQSLERDEVIKGVTSEGLIDAIKESQEICFIPDDDYISFIKKRLPEGELHCAFSKGDFTDIKGNVLGQHNGYACYTVGQRKGLGIALGRPAYVIQIDSERNRVVLGFDEDNRCTEFDVSHLNFVSLPQFEGEARLLVRPRYRSPLIECTVRVNGDRARVTTEAPIKLVSPGQSAVFYDTLGRVVFGGHIV